MTTGGLATRRSRCVQTPRRHGASVWGLRRRWFMHTLSHSPSPMQTQPPHLDGLQRLAGHGVALRVAEQRQQVRVVA
jgi:hypothetical protein